MTLKNTLYPVILLTLAFFAPQGILAQEPDPFASRRRDMVERQILARGVKDIRVLRAMEKVPRHLFVPKRYRAVAYGDHALPIGAGQTISQPYIVAYMTEALDLGPGEKVLEIGTGSGYQAAVLAELVKEVYTIEIIETLGKRARETLDKLGYGNIHLMIGDGYQGWPDASPFDAVIVTCAPEEVPSALVQQLKEGGRMILPIGKAGAVQRLVRAVKKDGRLVRQKVMDVRFVPMVRGRD
jgi:protein-L-isoaspartate(D-aspartate) O-methyltransferase